MKILISLSTARSEKDLWLRRNLLLKRRRAKIKSLLKQGKIDPTTGRIIKPSPLTKKVIDNLKGRYPNLKDDVIKAAANVVVAGLFRAELTKVSSKLKIFGNAIGNLKRVENKKLYRGEHLSMPQARALLTGKTYLLNSGPKSWTLSQKVAEHYAIPGKFNSTFSRLVTTVISVNAKEVEPLLYLDRNILNVMVPPSERKTNKLMAGEQAGYQEEVVAKNNKMELSQKNCLFFMLRVDSIKQYPYLAETFKHLTEKAPISILKFDKSLIKKLKEPKTVYQAFNNRSLDTRFVFTDLYIKIIPNGKKILLLKESNKGFKILKSSTYKAIGN